VTKKHFIAFAYGIVSDLRNGVITRETAEYCANIVAAVAVSDNPRFNRERFMKACGLS